MTQDAKIPLRYNEKELIEQGIVIKEYLDNHLNERKQDPVLVKNWNRSLFIIKQQILCMRNLKN